MRPVYVCQLPDEMQREIRGILTRLLLYQCGTEEKAEKYCLSDVFNSISFKYLKNEKSDNAYDAAQYCYFKKFYYSKRT